MAKDTIAEKVKALRLIIEKRKAGRKRVPFYAYPAYMKQQKLLKQGFKIYVSATFLNSEQIFDIAIPYLLEHNIAFKVVAANSLLRLLNEDRFGYTQVGKFITIYPNSVSHFVTLIHELDKRLINFEAPHIPSDIRLHEKSIVYYRYGVIDNPDNALILPNGSIVKDERNPNLPVPTWIEDPLQQSKTLQKPIPKKLLLDCYILLKILRQRAKGLVAMALDVGNTSPATPKVLILKEARRLGALNDQGGDAIARLEKEFALIQEVSKLGICPNPIEFTRHEGSAFMSMNFWGEKSLRTALLEKEPPSKAILVKICLAVAQKLAQLHAKEIYFFDMSPDNILLNAANEVLLSDFEYRLTRSACSF